VFNNDFLIKLEHLYMSQHFFQKNVAKNFRFTPERKRAQNFVSGYTLSLIPKRIGIRVIHIEHTLNLHTLSLFKN